MNSIRDLWRRRIAFLVKLYYDFIAFQLDIVSLLYIGAMAVFVGYYYYPELEGYIQFIQQEPWSYLVYFFSVKIAGGGKHAGYLKEADELFLTPLNLYGKKFIRYSHFLNRLQSFLSWGIWVGILTVLGILTLNPVGFFLTGILWRYLGMNGRFFLHRISGRWMRRIGAFFYSLLFFSLTFLWVLYWDPIIGQGVGFILLSLLIGLTLWWTEDKKQRVDFHWSRMISEETNRRAQRLSAIIQVVPEEKSRGINTTKTLKIFSGRKILPFTPLGGALMAFERRMRRGQGNLSLLLKIAMVHWVALAFAEITMVQIVMNILVFFIVQEFCLSLWNGVLDEDWFHIYPFSNKTIRTGITVGSFGYVLLYMMVSFILQYFRWGNLMEVLQMFAASGALIFLVNQFRGSTVYFDYTSTLKSRRMGKREVSKAKN